MTGQSFAERAGPHRELDYARQPAFAQKVDAILMASGFSRRFGGRNKLLTPFLGIPLMAHTLALATRVGGFENIFVVAAREEVAALCRQYPVRVICNRNPARGVCESVRLGVSASSADHYLFFPCDQPLLDEETIYAVLQAQETGRIVVPVCKGRPGTPVLFSASFREELLALPDGGHPRLLKQRHPKALKEVPCANELAFADIDTPEALQALEAMARQGGTFPSPGFPQ